MLLQALFSNLITLENSHQRCMAVFLSDLCILTTVLLTYP